MIEETLVVGPFQCNCRILVCPSTHHAVIIDPGDEPAKILARIQQIEKKLNHPVQIRALFHTHGHLDHIAATKKVKEAFSGAPHIYLHRDDEFIYNQLSMQGNMFGLQYDNPLPVDHYFHHEDRLKVGNLKFSIIHTPGHSPGSVCLQLHQDTATKTPEKLYTGDTLFQGSVGRTDLWGGDTDLMFKNIRERILVLDTDTPIAPGHGPDSTIGIEKTQNPFLT